MKHSRWRGALGRRGWMLAFAVACGSRASGPPTPIAQPPPVADILKTCAFEVSCLKDPLTSSFDTCVNVLQDVLAEQGQGHSIFATYVDCARTAADCTSVLRCASQDHDPTYCAAHPGQSCDGDLLVSCASPGAIVDWAIANTDCAALGMHCEVANGTAVCTDGTSCDPEATSTHCDGNTLVSCNRTARLTYPLDCSRSSIVNATCRSGTPSSYFGCLPSGPPCRSPTDRCDDDVLVHCVAGEEMRVDCAALASYCSVGRDFGSCVPNVAQCSGSAACSGAAIASCVDGTPHAIDCSAIGLSSCTTTSGGAVSCQ